MLINPSINFYFSFLYQRRWVPLAVVLVALIILFWRRCPILEELQDTLKNSPVEVADECTAGLGSTVMFIVVGYVVKKDSTVTVSTRTLE
jgi:cell division protein FtsX